MDVRFSVRALFEEKEEEILFCITKKKNKEKKKKKCAKDCVCVYYQFYATLWCNRDETRPIHALPSMYMYRRQWSMRRLESQKVRLAA